MEEHSKKVQYWVAFAVALATMTSSVSFSWSTPIIPKFHNNETAINITDTEISWMLVMTSPGVMLGTIASQYQSDKFGRRSTLLASAFPFAIGTMFILFATKAWMLYIARFLWGIGAGIIQNVAMIFISEIAAKEIRGSLTVGNRFLFNFGNFMVVAIGSFVTYSTLSLMLIVLPAAYFLACWWVPESPYHLLKEGKVATARKVLMKLNGYKDEKILEQKLSEMRLHVKEDMKRSATVKELFTGKRYRKPLAISFGLRMCQLMSGTIPINQYLGRIIQETGAALSVSTGLIIYAAVRFVACMLASAVVDKIGRRPLLIFSFLGGCISFAIVGTCFFIHEVVINAEYSTLSGYIIFIGIVCYITVSTIGFDTLIFVIPAEIFPLNVKSIAMTCMNLFGGVVTFISVAGYQVIKDWMGLYGVFWIFGFAAFIGAVFSYVMVLETRGKSLRDIQIELQGVLYEEECEKVDHVNAEGAKNMYEEGTKLLSLSVPSK